ncbi:pseudouridine synthase 7 [Nomia melanderi]|uniref:pseudouridine synthase 7 n=1 Tax=Nomia melanderi TaxID=2448451 RepID=UPI00130473AA|nr:pseudouridylate synthase 7 homolog [Nomia melanderi]
MSHLENKNVDLKDGTRNKDEKGFRKDSRFNKNFRRNRDSYYGHQKDSFSRKPFKRNWSNTQNDGKRKKLEVGSRLKEHDVGITEFIGNEGFFGLIKERYTDFHVNEIALDGQIAKLTNQDMPEDPRESENLEDLKDTISDTIWNQLQTLKEPEASTIEIDVTNIDKDQRRAIHTIAKQITNVISQTIDKENKKIMVILPDKNDNSNNHILRKDNRINWKKCGEYCYFVLHKVNMDTMDALNQLAMNLRIKPNNFNYAGTKDRRAWTSQWVSLRKMEPSHVLRAAKNVRGAYVGNFKFMKDSLKLGMLNGNHFRIALRNVNGTDEQIEKTMVSLKKNGFINYYGLQRFGSVVSIPTYEIGKTLLQGKWNEAIELILKPREGEQDKDLAEARKIYATTKDAVAAYKKIKRYDKIEATLLKGLCISGNNNPQGALDAIPRNARLMYIHAYQSFVWNHMVSRRIKEFGKAPVIGDLVYENDNKQNDNDSEELVYDNENVVQTEDKMESDEKCETMDVPKEEITETSTEATHNSIKEVTDATECCLKINEKIEGNSNVGEKDEDEDLRKLPAVKVLKEKDLPNYTLADILMPQVGWKVTYPSYAKTWYDEFLANHGLTTDLRQKNKKYSLGGVYRKILQVPTNLSWKTMHYKERHSDLIMCDIDEMRKLSAPKDEPEGQYKALIVEMSLKSSTYATMALREILKLDTSPQAQAAQSAACNAELENDDVSIAVQHQSLCSVSDNDKDMHGDKNLKMEEKELSDSDIKKTE